MNKQAFCAPRIFEQQGSFFAIVTVTSNTAIQPILPCRCWIDSKKVVTQQWRADCFC